MNERTCSIGTLDDDLCLPRTSPAIDAGDNTAIPADSPDLDGDGDGSEIIHLDMDLLTRFGDMPGGPDSGVGPPPIVDFGAYEVQPENIFLPVILR